MSFTSQLKVGFISFKKGFASQGVFKTFSMFGEALIDECYNWKMGYDVGGFFDPERANLEVENRQYANFYQPVRVRPFRALFKKMQIPTSGRFVDIGSGKGKALILAADLGFESVLGVELFSELNEIAKKNVARYQSRKQSLCKFEVLTADASSFGFSANDSCIFLNDPFSDELMNSLAKNVLKSYGENPRRLYFIYKNNNLRVMPSLDILKQHAQYQTFEMSGNFFEIFIFP